MQGTDIVDNGNGSKEKGETKSEIKQPEFYLVSPFSKFPYPTVSLSILIVAIFFISAYRVFLGIERVSTLEFCRFYLGNTVYSILSILFITLIYNNVLIGTNSWINQYELLQKDGEINTKLKLIHNFFFTKNHLLIVSFIVVGRRIIAYVNAGINLSKLWRNIPY